MKCMNCKADISNGANFCMECGAKVVKKPVHNITCSNCGANVTLGSKFCAKCGHSLNESTTNQITQSMPQSTPQQTIQPITQSYSQPVIQQTHNYQRKKKKPFLLIVLSMSGIIALVLVAVLIVNSLYQSFTDRISSNYDDDVKEIVNLNDFEYVDEVDDFVGLDEIVFDEDELKTIAETLMKEEPSGTEAINIEPIKGVVLKADENALDKNRDFKVSKLEFGELNKLNSQIAFSDVMPITAIEIDSGMKENERFIDTLDVEIDLLEFEIPEDMWEFLEVVRIDGEEECVPMHAFTEGNKLKFSTSRNSTFVILCTLFAGASGLYVYFNRSDKFGNKELVYTDIYDGYYLYWPKELASANPNEVENQYSNLKAIAKKYGYSETDLQSLYDDEDGYFSFLYSVYSDADFKSTLRLIKSKDWQKNNLYPEFVGKTLDNINEAREYLFVTRKIKKPDHIDYIILDPWPHKVSELGITDGSSVETETYLMPLYIHVKYLTGSIDWVDQFLTIVHETFHIAQNEYFFSNGLANLFFCETSAVKMQFDANDDLKKGYIEKPDDRQYIEEARRTFGENNSVKQDIQNQGYFYSYYLDDLETFYNKYSKGDFMTSIIKTYKSTKSPMETFLSVNKERSVFFRYFYLKRSKDFIKFAISNKIKNADIHKARNINMLTTPFSAVVSKYYFVDNDADKKVKYLYRATKGSIDADKLSIVLVNDKGDKSEIIEPAVPDGEVYDIAIPGIFTNTRKGDIGSSKEVYISQIQYAQSTSQAGQFSLYIMEQPDKPTIEFINEDLINIKLNESKQSPELVGSYMVYIKYPKGDVYKIESKTREFDIPAVIDGNNVIDYMKKNKDIVSIEKFELNKEQLSSFDDNKIKVKYGEITNSTQKIVGPHSGYSELNTKVDITIIGEKSITYEVEAGEKVKHEFEAISDYSKECYIVWNFDDSSDEVIVRDNESKLSHSFKKSGEFNVSATLFDEKDSQLGKDSIAIDIDYFNDGVYKGVLNFATVVSATRDRYEYGENKITITDYGKEFRISFGLSYEEWESYEAGDRVEWGEDENGNTTMLSKGSGNANRKILYGSGFTARPSKGYDEAGNLMYEFSGTAYLQTIDDDGEKDVLDTQSFDPEVPIIVVYYPELTSGEYSNVVIYRGYNNNSTLLFIAEGFVELSSQ